MNEEEKALLLETVTLARENNKMLKKMRRDVRIGRFIHSLKWIVIISALIWSYILIQPYLESLQEMYKNIQNTQQSVADFQGKFQIPQEGFDNFLKSFNVGN